MKRSAEPVILEVLPGTDLHEPVRMDMFGMESMDLWIVTDFRSYCQGLNRKIQRFKDGDWSQEVDLSTE